MHQDHDTSALSHPLGGMIRRLERHAVLDDNDRAALAGLPRETRRVAAGQVVARAGEVVTEHQVIVSGLACRFKDTGDGARQIIAFHLPGESICCPTLFLDVADQDAMALTESEFAVVPRAAFRAVARQRPAIERALLMVTLVEGAILAEALVNAARRDGRTRVAHLLCELALRFDAAGLASPNGIDLPLTQEQIGDALGLTPVHVNRMLRSLAEAGLIERRGSRVSFPRWNALKEAADFDATYLHLDQRRV